MSDEVATQEGTQPESSPVQSKEYAWMAQLPPKYNNDDEIKSLGGFGGLADAYKQAREQLNSLPKPPEKPDGYKVDGKGIFGNSEAKQAFLTLAHQSGLTQSQVEKLAPFANDLVSAALGEKEKKQATDFKETKRVLSEEWGEDGFDKNLKVVKRGVDKLSEKVGEDVTKLFVDYGMDNHPTLVKMFYEVGKMLSEDSFVSGSVSGKDKDPSPYLKYKSPKK